MRKEVELCLMKSIFLRQPREIREHCERVANLCADMAENMRLPASRLDRVQAAAFFHEALGECILKQKPLAWAIIDLADYFDETTNGGIGSATLDDVMNDIRCQAGERFSPAAVKALMKVVLSKCPAKA